MSILVAVVAFLLIHTLLAVVGTAAGLALGSRELLGIAVLAAPLALLVRNAWVRRRGT